MEFQNPFDGIDPLVMYRIIQRVRTIAATATELARDGKAFTIHLEPEMQLEDMHATQFQVVVAVLQEAYDMTAEEAVAHLLTIGMAFILDAANKAGVADAVDNAPDKREDSVAVGADDLLARVLN
jgi:hypothetical protein